MQSIKRFIYNLFLIFLFHNFSFKEATIIYIYVYTSSIFEMDLHLIGIYGVRKSTFLSITVYRVLVSVELHLCVKSNIFVKVLIY